MVLRYRPPLYTPKTDRHAWKDVFPALQKAALIPFRFHLGDRGYDIPMSVFSLLEGFQSWLPHLESKEL